MFFSFDGIDGTGKSTQLELFCQWLRDEGHDVVTCRDPGSTDLGEALREILLTRGEMQIDMRSEMLIYMAARAQLVQQIIRPALDAGKIVVSDRFLLANIVYQAYAGGLDVEQVRSVGEIAIDGISPDATFLLDMPVAMAAERMDRELDRLEARGPDYLERVRQGFLTEAANSGGKVVAIDASRSIDEVQSEIRNVAQSHLGVT